MADRSHASVHIWIFSFAAGVITALLFAKKKGTTLRAELAETGETTGVLGQVVSMKNEFGSMLEEMQDVWESEKVQVALQKLAVLTKELLPRIEGDKKN